jgi:glycosyltransferase involved in cell wall biosynthesis
MKPSSKSNPVILFLNENPLPAEFTTATIPGKELRLRTAIDTISAVHVITFKGTLPIHHQSKERTMLEKKIIVHRLPPWPHYVKTIPLLVYGAYLIMKLKPASIEAESPLFSGLAAVMLHKLTRVPALIEVRTTFSSMLHHRLPWIPAPVKSHLLDHIQRFVLSQATAVIVNSRYYRNWLRTLGIEATIINPGLQLAFIPIHNPSHPPPIILGYMGRLVSEKGPQILIQAITHLREQNDGLPPFQVHIAGNGPLKSSLIQSIKQCKLSSIIKLVGQKPNTVIATYDILINPCLVDAPLEMVNVEAAAMGVPVVTFGRSDCPETVIHGQTGIVVKTKTPAALAKAIRMLMINENKRITMGQKALKRIPSSYLFNNQVTRLHRLYRQLNLL